MIMLQYIQHHVWEIPRMANVFSGIILTVYGRSCCIARHTDTYSVTGLGEA